MEQHTGFWPWPTQDEEDRYDDRHGDDEDDQETWYCFLCNLDVSIWIGDNDPLPTHCPICGCEFEQDRP